MSLFRVDNLASQPVESGGRRITLHTQAFRIGEPFIPFGLLWHRPSAVSVQEPDGTHYTIPVVDITRIAQIALIGIGLIGAILIGRMYHD